MSLITSSVVCTVHCCACGETQSIGSSQPLAASASLTLWSSAVRAAVLCVDMLNCRYVKCNAHCCVFHPGMWWEVRGLTQWESVEREGRGSVQCWVSVASGKAVSVCYLHLSVGQKLTVRYI